MNRLLRKLLPGLLLSGISFAAATAPDANADVRKLVTDVIYRYEGETQLSRMSLVTCSYKIENEKIGCVSSPRKKTLQSVVKKSGEKLADSKGFTLILEPVSEAGISILQYDYYQTGKDADQWLYLPEMGNVKRVASPADAPKAGSLFGSEFALEDLEKPKMENYEVSLVKESTYSDRPVIIVEQKPTAKQAKKTNYSKHILWIDAERLLILKNEFYGWNGELVKINYSSNIEKIGDVWTVKKSVMQNTESKRISVITWDDVNYNQPISDEILTQRMLSDAVFQKSRLQTLLQKRKES